MHVTRLHYPAVDLKPGLFLQSHLFLLGLPPDVSAPFPSVRELGFILHSLGTRVLC